MTKKRLDVAIIGGGPAGLNAALVLGRARKNVAVIDEGKPRNRVTRETHGFLTRDGVSPAEFRRIAREECSAYPSVLFVQDTATAISGKDGHFEVTTAQGETYISQKLLFAVGMKDIPLRIAGLADVYGTSAFVCPYCDGWELRDKPLVIIHSGSTAVHFAALIAGWTSRFTICTNGPGGLTDSEREELRKRNVPFMESPIRSIDSVDGMVRQVVLEDGTLLPCEGIFFKPELAPGSDLPQSLGCELTEAGTLVVDEFGKTSVPGIYSAGDATTLRHQAIAAASMGAFAAAAINGELSMESWNRRA